MGLPFSFTHPTWIFSNFFRGGTWSVSTGLSPYTRCEIFFGKYFKHFIGAYSPSLSGMKSVSGPSFLAVDDESLVAAVTSPPPPPPVLTTPPSTPLSLLGLQPILMIVRAHNLRTRPSSRSRFRAKRFPTTVRTVASRRIRPRFRCWHRILFTRGKKNNYDRTIIIVVVVGYRVRAIVSVECQMLLGNDPTGKRGNGNYQQRPQIPEQIENGYAASAVTKTMRSITNLCTYNATAAAVAYPCLGSRALFTLNRSASFSFALYAERIHTTVVVVYIPWSIPYTYIPILPRILLYCDYRYCY